MVLKMVHGNTSRSLGVWITNGSKVVSLRKKWMNEKRLLAFSMVARCSSRGKNILFSSSACRLDSRNGVLLPCLNKRKSKKHLTNLTSSSLQSHLSMKRLFLRVAKMAFTFFLWQHSLKVKETVTATNRSSQWRSKVVEPLYESKNRRRGYVPFCEKIWFL